MKNLILAALALSTLAVGAATASTPGYDRPDAHQAGNGGKAHLVYWSAYFEHFTNSPQLMADTYSVDDIAWIGQGSNKHDQTASTSKDTTTH